MVGTRIRNLFSRPEGLSPSVSPLVPWLFHGKNRAPGLAMIALAIAGLLMLQPGHPASAQEPASAAAAGEATNGEAFAQWLEGVREEALGRGISDATLAKALEGIAPIPRVIELDRRQPEFTLTFDQYISRVVPDQRVEAGRQNLERHRELLEPIGRAYGVQPRFIVALWGIETNFGRTTGSFPVIASLATLAFDGRRSAYFRRELMNALTILEEGHIEPGNMMGSWAGAMGQNQFMPSSFLAYAVDHDGDGRRNIWTSEADVFASAANYLKNVGWRGDETWGRLVRLPDGFTDDDMARLMPASPPAGCRALRRLSVEKPLSAWQDMGVRRLDGTDLPTRELDASLVVPEGAGGPAMLVYNNFRSTLRWNCSIAFAAAVGILADKIAAR